jgi:hypothetical protein
MGRVGSPDSRQVTSTVTSSQLFCVSLIPLDSIAGLYRDQGWGYDVALNADRRELPVQRKTDWSGFVASAQRCGFTQLTHHLSNRNLTIQNYAQEANFAIGFSNSNRNFLSIDIKTNKSHFFTDRLLSLVPLRRLSLRHTA